MAYMTKNGKGPYPNKAGEYYGNHHKDSLPLSSSHETPEQAARHLREYLAKMRFGRPRPCPAGTSAEMAEQGYVGLYLKEDSKHGLDTDVDVPTPPEFAEPPGAPS